MSIGEVQARISQIRSLLAPVPGGTVPATGPSASAGASSATSRSATAPSATTRTAPATSSASEFAGALAKAVAATPAATPAAAPVAPPVRKAAAARTGPVGGTAKADGADAVTRTTSSRSVAPTSGSGGGADTWVRPAKGSVTSGFGARWGAQHEGIDIANGTGTPVRAATDGVVKKASWYGGYGNAVIIDHGGGVKTLYGHNSKLVVKPGQRVSAGQIVAKMGSTGDSTGPHLHFEVHVRGKAVNPRPYLKDHGVKL